MDRSTTNKIKGIAMLTVLFSHGADMGCFGIVHRDYFAWLCIAGMSCFIFLSGFGLYTSYSSKRLYNFWEKRFKSVMIPYMIYMTIMFAIRLVQGQKYSFIDYLGMITGTSRNNIIDGSMWYVNFILLYYWFFFVCFMINNEVIAVLVFATISLLTFRFMYLFFHPDYVSIQFLLGIIFAKIHLKYSPIVVKKSVKVVIMIATSCAGVFLMQENYHAYTFGEIILKSLAAILLMISLCIFVSVIPFELKFLDVLGKNSLYVYLVEANFIYGGYYVYKSIGTNVFSFAVLLLFTLIFAWLLKKLYCLFNHHITI